MLYPARLRLIAHIAISAIAAAIAAGHASGQVTVKEADLPKLIEAARKAGVEVQYETATTTEEAAGKGSDVIASGDASKVERDSKAPNVGLRGGTTASGGDSKDSAQASVSGTTWFRILLALLGAGGIIGGAWKFKQGELDTAIALGVGGGILIAIALWPALLWLAVAAAVVAAATHFMPDPAKKALEQKIAQSEAKAKGIVTGIDALRSDPTHGPVVQNAMRQLKDKITLAMGKDAAALVNSEKTT